MKKRVRARRTLYYKLGLFIIKRRFGKVRFNLVWHSRGIKKYKEKTCR